MASFADACGLYDSAVCGVGAKRLHGNGCLIREGLVITALHVLTEAKGGAPWTVLKHDGIWRADLVFQDEDRDVAALRPVELLKGGDLRKPEALPSLSDEPVFMGAHIGYMARTQMKFGFSKDDEFSPLSFHSVHASFRVPNKLRHWAMTGEHVEHGMSGGPCFTPNGKLVGVIVQTLFRPGDAPRPVACLPVMAEIYDLREKILAAAG